MKHLTACLGISVALACGAFAQEPTPKPKPPSGPLIARRAPEFAEWVLTTTTKSSGPAANSTPVPAGAPADAKPKPASETVKVTKTGDVRHVSTVASDGTKSDIWCQGATQVIIRPEWKEPLLSTGENTWDEARIDFGSSDFAGFAWISTANFVNVTKVSGQDCLIFKDKILPFGVNPKDRPINEDGSPAKPIDFEKLKVPATACIDVESRLPVALQVGDAVTSYKFGNPPTAKLTLPPEAQNVIKAWDQKLQKMLRKPAAP